MTDTYDLVLPFDTDDPEFCRGFEAGTLWERLKQQPEEVEEIVHEGNQPLLREMAHRLGYRLECEDVRDGWMGVTLRRLE